jgi:hypothetical protein
MSDYDLQKSLQSLAAVLNYIVAKSIGEDLAWERRDGDSG